ncbi:MAG: hypothetical protein D6748_14050 [Calditrichaeota bacterium]|nr:MAG: hypothetical protein D6748_14050 [Calditrichota bacterium]
MYKCRNTNKSTQTNHSRILNKKINIFKFLMLLLIHLIFCCQGGIVVAGSYNSSGSAIELCKKFVLNPCSTNIGILSHGHDRILLEIEREREKKLEKITEFFLYVAFLGDYSDETVGITAYKILLENIEDALNVLSVLEHSVRTSVTFSIALAIVQTANQQEFLDAFNENLSRINSINMIPFVEIALFIDEGGVALGGDIACDYKIWEMAERRNGILNRIMDIVRRKRGSNLSSVIRKYCAHKDDRFNYNLASIQKNTKSKRQNTTSGRRVEWRVGNDNQIEKVDLMYKKAKKSNLEKIDLSKEGLYVIRNYSRLYGESDSRNTTEKLCKLLKSECRWRVKEAARGLNSTKDGISKACIIGSEKSAMFLFVAEEAYDTLLQYGGKYRSVLTNVLHDGGNLRMACKYLASKNKELRREALNWLNERGFERNVCEEEK